MKGMTRKELMDELKLKGGGQLSEILENLKNAILSGNMLP